MAATFCRDKSLRVYWRPLVKIFVAATEFCRSNKSHNFFFATCCSDKILLQRQRFSQKVSSTHEAISRSNIWVQLVARPVHTEWSVANLSHSVFTSSSFSYSAPGARDGPGRRGPWEWGRKHTRVSLIKTNNNCPEKFKITIILQVLYVFWRLVTRLEMDCNYFEFGVVTTATAKRIST